MATKVVCLTNPRLQRYRRIADSMYEGIRRHGDSAVIADVRRTAPNGDVGIVWGWKCRDVLARFPKFAYADMGYWNRGEYFRFTVGGWSPDGYVKQGRKFLRFKNLGIKIQPWKDGDEIVIAGSSRKACRDHGFEYMQWETEMARRLSGHKVAYRPKPRDLEARPISGTRFDCGPIEDTLSTAKVIVTHHSNTAIDALVAGVPVYCETGAAAAFSIKLHEITNPPRLEGREQFLADVAWLQWTHKEMESGECWAYLKEQMCL